MGYIFEKLKISAKRLNTRFMRISKFSNTDLFKTCDFGLNSCLLTPKMVLFSPLFHIFMNDNKSTWSSELGDEITARNSDVES